MDTFRDSQQISRYSNVWWVTVGHHTMVWDHCLIKNNCDGVSRDIDYGGSWSFLTRFYFLSFTYVSLRSIKEIVLRFEGLLDNTYHFIRLGGSWIFLPLFSDWEAPGKLLLFFVIVMLLERNYLFSHLSGSWSIVTIFLHN